MYKELGEKYGITEKQARELDEQYWMEYVLGSVYRLQRDSIILSNLCSFRISKGKLIKTANGLRFRLKDISVNSKYYAIQKELIRKLENLIILKNEETIKSDSKRAKISS